MANKNRSYPPTNKRPPEGPPQFYILSCGFTFSTLNFKFSSTFVERTLQIKLFMQNKPNFRKSQMNVNKVLTMNYEHWTLGYRGKNKPNSNPIQSQSKPKQTQSNPTCRGVASGEAGHKPNFSQFPIILVSLNWLCIISFSVMVTLQIFMEIL